MLTRIEKVVVYTPTCIELTPANVGTPLGLAGKYYIIQNIYANTNYRKLFWQSYAMQYNVLCALTEKKFTVYNEYKQTSTELKKTVCSKI